MRVVLAYVDVDLISARAFLQCTLYCLQLQSSKPLSHNLLERLDEVNDFSKSGNCEILFAWIRVGLKSYWPEIIPTALEFVTRYGRLKYVQPVYK